MGHNLSEETLKSLIGQHTQAGDSATIDHAAAPLTQFLDLTQYTDARIIFTKTSATTTGKLTHVTFGNPLARFTTRLGNEIPHQLLSFGEKRLLTFLISLDAEPTLIIIDELANGFHHAWLERAMELLEDFGSQAFLSSQNPLQLDCMPLSRDTFGRQHTLVICELNDSGEMIWRNLSEAETDDFFKSLDVGIQHVSEIMRSKGLW